MTVHEKLVELQHALSFCVRQLEVAGTVLSEIAQATESRSIMDVADGCRKQVEVANRALKGGGR